MEDTHYHWMVVQGWAINDNPQKTQMNKMVMNERGTVNVLGQNVPDTSLMHWKKQQWRID